MDWNLDSEAYGISSAMRTDWMPPRSPSVRKASGCLPVINEIRIRARKRRDI
jgi:hypothetical protein